MAVWPVDLPQYPTGAVSVELQDSRIRSQPDTGPPLMRRRYTSAIRTVEAPMILTGAELAIFDEFYETTLLHGTQRFQWFDFRTDELVQYRFVEPPKWMTLHGDQSRLPVAAAMTRPPSRHDAAMVALGQAIYGASWELPPSLSGTMPASPRRKLTPEAARICFVLRTLINEKWPNRDVTSATALFDALGKLQEECVVELIARAVARHGSRGD